jgi:putative hydrolase of the HAD superfamily
MPAEQGRPETIIGFDGDDTLWHNENILWSAETKFQQLLRHYMSPDEISQKLYDTGMRNLALFGYGAKSFILSMIETAIEVTDGRVAVADIQALIGFLKEIRRHPVHLIDDASRIVSELSRRYKLILISKGDLLHQEQKVASSGLAEYFMSVEIVAEKDKDVYGKVLKKHAIAPSNFIMVGNSLRSDIEPMLRLGARAVHIPYEITWKHEQNHNIDLNERYYRCRSIVELPEKIREIETELTTSRSADALRRGPAPA